MNKREYLVLIFVVCLGLVAGHYTFNVIKDAYSVYTAENECIAMYVSQGVERRDIVRENGTCKVKE